MAFRTPVTWVAAAAAAALGCDPPLRAVPSGPLLHRIAAPPTGVAPPVFSAPRAAEDGGAPPAEARATAVNPLGPESAESPLIELTVPGYAKAVVSLPIGATAPRPVLIASHGNYDRPEWQCEVWREIVGNRAFILCPRGVARRDSPAADDIRFTYENNKRLEAEIDAGLAALAARFPQHVDRGAAVYTGFSLGAITGVAIASRRPALFPRLVLIEGGHDKWTGETARTFRAGGGLRVLFVCAQAGCGAAARSAASRLSKAGVAVRVVQSREAGHRYDGPVAEETKKALSWALEGDARWDTP